MFSILGVAKVSSICHSLAIKDLTASGGTKAGKPIDVTT